MKVTAAEEYGLRCLLVIAREYKRGNAVSIKDVARSENLTTAYAGKLLGVLRDSGLVTASRGRSGGYMLARSPEEIQLKQVMDAFGEPVLSKDHCRKYRGDGDECVHVNNCTVRSVWRDLDRFVASFFSNITVEDLVNGGYRRNNIDLFFGRVSPESNIEDRQVENTFGS